MDCDLNCELAKGQGKTVLISSHILTELAEMSDCIGIIERGQLLATGSVEQIRAQMGTHRDVVVRVLTSIDPSRDWLAKQPEITSLRTEQDLIYFSHPGTRADEARWLRQLIEAGCEIAEFRSEEKTLEEVFMHVTQGIVQ